MNQKYPLIGVALGPGDPELITVKGLNALKNADVIYYPASVVDGDRIESFSKPILDAYNLEVECKPLCFPMTGKNREAFYQEAYEQLKADVILDKKVVIVNEGDLLFYSTFGYILALAQGDGMIVEAISGIPAFVASGAASLMPIVEGDTTFTVIARPKSFDQIKAELQKKSSVVVMKMKVIKGWYEFLKSGDWEFSYIEKVGTPQQFVTSNIEDLHDREVPYFALILLKKN